MEEFKQCLVNEDKSDKTIRAYTGAVKMFNEWFAQSNGRPPAPTDITSIDLREFRQYLLKSRELAVGTVNNYLAAMRKYLRWANEQGLLPTGLPVLPREVKNSSTRIAPRSLTKKQQDELLKAVERFGDVLRDKTIITILMHTGLRNSEIRNLTINDIEISPRGGMIRVWGKGGKFRIVPLNNEARRILQEYLDAHPVEDYLFTSTRGPKAGGKMSGVALQNIFNKYKDAVPELRGDDDITVHSLRHTFATRMLEAGRSLVEVQTLLGHENINTTAIYTKPHMNTLQDAVNSLCDG